MSQYIFAIKEIIRGKSVTRSLLNFRLSKEILQGKTIDIGGGKSADYIDCMKKNAGTEFLTFDMKIGDKVDFEIDTLPAQDGSYDTVLFLNVMEHIFNFQHIANEVVRVLKTEGKLIGFVPFLMWYHPDHKDFFRYTHEALEKIFTEAGGKDIHIEPVTKGPFLASAQMKILSLPRILRPFIFTTAYFLDVLYELAGKKTSRYALGYMFIIKK